MEYRNMRITDDYRDCVMCKEWQSLISSLSEILKSFICRFLFWSIVFLYTDFVFPSHCQSPLYNL